MGIKAAGADLGFKGGLFNGARWVALYSAEATELSGNAYARVQRALSNWTENGAGMVNSGQIDFPQPNPAAWPEITHWGLHSHATNAALLLQYDSTDTAAPQLGAPVGMLDATIGWRFTDHVTAIGGQKMCSEGLVSGTRALTLHEGDPGATGANMIDQAVTVAAGLWTADTQAANAGEGTHPKRRRLRNNAVVSFGAAITDLPKPTYIALRDGTGANANVLWRDQLPADVLDPALGDTLSVSTNTLAIYCPID